MYGSNISAEYPLEFGRVVIRAGLPNVLRPLQDPDYPAITIENSMASLYPDGYSFPLADVYSD